ncbi:MAG TPA: tetrahydrofolate dehydrogenase/cyclohydrolase catalytic domain-containing protein, partial [Holophagaceae bacterium]|nr:tetrahydrofolate dehydrogenase/cyclohydrolase catalytic domain-containing protein [Holophagaceae bacterium]
MAHEPTGRLDCNETATHYRELVRSNIEKLGFAPGLAVILGCDDLGCITYHRWLLKDCEELGVDAKNIAVKKGIELVQTVARLNQDDKTHGVFIFYPLRYPELKDDE